MVRKLILLEVNETSGAYLVGIAAVLAALALGLMAIRWVENQSSD